VTASVGATAAALVILVVAGAWAMIDAARLGPVWRFAAACSCAAPAIVAVILSPFAVSEGDRGLVAAAHALGLLVVAALLARDALRGGAS
jgi:hypothetical protein